MRKQSALLVLLIAVLTGGEMIQPGQAQGPSAVPDEIAYSTLFQILRTEPPPHWDHQTKCNWLAPDGLRDEDVFLLVRAADEYFRRVAGLNEKLKRHYAAFAGRIQSAEAQAGEAQIQQERTQELLAVRTDLRARLTTKALAGLDSRIAEIKRNSRLASQPAGQRHH